MSITTNVIHHDYHVFEIMQTKEDISKKRKEEIVQEFGINKDTKDTGSVEVQCALITERIISITSHCKSHSHDYQAEKSLIALVVKRRRLLDYLSRTQRSRYEALIKKLGLRK